MYLTFLLLRYIIDRHLEYVRMGGICSGIEVAITRTIRNRLTVDPVRGFESHPLRHVGASCISLAPTFSKVRARSLRCSSFPNRTRFAGLRFGFGRNLERKSILPTYCSSEIPAFVPFPAPPKTALRWEFLRFPPRTALLGSRRYRDGDMG